MLGFPLAGLLLDYALAVPFAIALAVHNQILDRPNFHLAAIYAGGPLVASSLHGVHGAFAALFISGLICLLGSLGVDLLAARVDRLASRGGVARSFFVSIAIYLFAIQILTLIFGAAPLSFNLRGFGSITVGGLDLPTEGLVAAGFGVVATASVIVWVDTRFGARLRFAAGKDLDVSHAGLSGPRFRFLAGLVVGLLVAVASLSKAVVVPFSVYSAFPTFVLCFCAAAVPPGSRLLLTAVLLFVIYSVRAVAAFYLSAQIADAVTLVLSLGLLTTYLMTASFRDRT